MDAHEIVCAVPVNALWKGERCDLEHLKYFIGMRPYTVVMSILYARLATVCCSILVLASIQTAEKKKAHNRVLEMSIQSGLQLLNV